VGGLAKALPGGVKIDIFQNGKTKCLGHTPQQHFRAIWKHVDFGGRPRASLGAPRVIQGNQDSEKYNSPSVGSCVILIGFGELAKALPRGVEIDNFQNGKTKCLGHTPQQHFRAIWKHVDCWWSS